VSVISELSLQFSWSDVHYVLQLIKSQTICSSVFGFLALCRFFCGHTQSL